jgi:TonB family protein
VNALTTSLLATASLLTSSMVLVSLPAAAEGCAPRAVQNETRFPERAQLRGHRGTVYVKVNIDENGRPTATSLHRSSGHRLLDRAAQQSVRKNWVFDVSTCTDQDLRGEHLVAVEYRNEEYGYSGKLAKHAAKKSEKNSMAALPAKGLRE